MVVAGFDVAKIKLDAVVYENSQPISPPWQVDNSPNEITKTLIDLKQAYSDLTIVCESTGNYHLKLVKACREQGIPMRILNPIVTKQQIRSTVRKTKTDTVDAGIIARLGCQGQGTLMVPMQYQTARTYVRIAIRLTKQTTVLKQLLHATSLIPDQEPVTSATKMLEDLLEEQESAIAKLYQTATESIDPVLLQLVQSVPGMGPKTAVAFITEVDHIGRFPNAKALVAYVGLDPAIRQSGHGPVHYGKLTKRGPSPLRRAIFLAAGVARQRDPEIKAAYEAKRAEGKAYVVATIHVARMLIHRLYAVLREQRPYEIRPVKG